MTKATSAPGRARSVSAGRAGSAPRRARCPTGDGAYTLGRAGAVQLRRRPHDRRRARSARRWAATSFAPPAPGQLARHGRRLLHDCRRHRCAARRARPRNGSPRARCSASRARDRRSATAAATTRSRSPRRRRCARPTASAPPRPRTPLPTDAVSPLFQAALEATEEAVYNSLLRATTVTGNGRTVEAIPIEKLKELLRRE